MNELYSSVPAQERRRRRTLYLGYGVKLLEFFHFAALTVATAAFSGQVAVEAQQHKEAGGRSEPLRGLRGSDTFVETNRHLRKRKRVRTITEENGRMRKDSSSRSRNKKNPGL